MHSHNSVFITNFAAKINRKVNRNQKSDHIIMTQRVRIKDIAEKAGVSVGTVDRILHQRPNVSKSAREKVERVLKEINYRPNMYASALAYNKSYTFHLIIPWHEQEAYWEEIEEGAMKASYVARKKVSKVYRKVGLR